VKLSVNRQEKTGPFGGIYYETEVRLSMSSEEEEVAKKNGLFYCVAIGDSDITHPESRLLFRLIEKRKISISDLTSGVTAKIKSESGLNDLVEFENLVKERCKLLKQHIEAAKSNKEAFQKGGSSYEEEL